MFLFECIIYNENLEGENNVKVYFMFCNTIFWKVTI